MNVAEIAGGVSPLQKRKAGYAGKHGIHATRGSGRAGRRRRRGFSKAGAKGVNVHGYTGATRFKFSPKKAGPLGPATTPKTGGTPGGGGGKGGGGNTTNSTYNIDNSRTGGDYRSYVDSFNQSLVQENVGNTNVDVVNKPKIDNTTTNTVKTDNITKVNQKNKSEQEIEQENKNITKSDQKVNVKAKGKYTYRQSWDDNNKNVQSKYKTFEEYEKAAIKWNNSAAGKAYWANKNKQSNVANQTTELDNTSDVDNTTNVDNTTSIDNSGAGIGDLNVTGATVGTGNFQFRSPEETKSLLEYNPSKRSPNKMKSHAWEMQQKMMKWRKAEGGTSPTKIDPMTMMMVADMVKEKKK